MNLAKDSMVVFIDGTEIPGFLLHGLFPAYADPQPSALDAAARARRHDLTGQGWQVSIWTVPVAAWLTGDAWQAELRRMLGSIVEQGAEVAWLASEGAPYADPPWLFDPTEMSGGVYGFLTADGRYSCPLDPGQPWAVVSDDELEEVRRAAPLSRS
ncbi:hypothetical protein CGZ98_05280 [Enemella evansiae]|uniref:hypothetical protein n=1 Tax=Enemella evansiae TaxID=2016499 RepID=UPI000B95D82D|nr:hypothetical protein [Enemella evansiae]OYO13837.1 hypothetical protein CGZ98_05280 [Enemella evansiae]